MSAAIETTKKGRQQRRKHDETEESLLRRGKQRQIEGTTTSVRQDVMVEVSMVGRSSEDERRSHCG